MLYLFRNIGTSLLITNAGKAGVNLTNIDSLEKYVERVNRPVLDICILSVSFHIAAGMRPKYAGAQELVQVALPENEPRPFKVNHWKVQVGVRVLNNVEEINTTEYIELRTISLTPDEVDIKGIAKFNFNLFNEIRYAKPAFLRYSKDLPESWGDIRLSIALTEECQGNISKFMNNPSINLGIAASKDDYILRRERLNSSNIKKEVA